MADASSQPRPRIDGVVVRPLEQHADARGWLIEVFRHDEVDFHPAMGYVSWTKPDTTRGPHEHRHQSDYFAFVWGRFRLHLWDNRSRSDTAGATASFEVGGEQPAMVIIPPGVVHAYTCTSPEGGLVLNLPDRLYAGLRRSQPVDEIRHESDPASPFRLES